MGPDVMEQPLLKKKIVFPNCPGCKAEYLKDTDAKLPIKELGIIAALTLVNALPISSLYPFLYFMVKNFHIAKSDKDIGFYAGYIGSAFMVGRFCTSVQWGMAADKYGRKPVMIIGVVSVIIFHTMFGLSTTFWMAVLSRFLLGCCNGMLGTVKAYASEICSSRHQAFSVSVVGTMWGLGLIIGPAMGGYLSQPSTKYPNMFPPGSIFDRFPYLLPSLCVTIIAFPTLYISFYLPETLHKHDIGDIEEVGDARCEEAVTVPNPDRLSRAGSRRYTVCEGLDTPTIHSPFGSLRESRFDDRFQCQDNVDALDDSNNKVVPPPEESQGYKVDVPEIEEDKALVPVLTNKLSDLAEKKSLLQSKPLVAAIALYCIWSLHDMAYTEIFSLWCVSPSSYGGLNLTTTDVGQILSISGGLGVSLRNHQNLGEHLPHTVACELTTTLLLPGIWTGCWGSGFTMLIFQIAFFAPLVNWMGAVLMARMAAAITVLLMATFPFMNMLHGLTLGLVLRGAAIVKNILSTMIFTSSFLLLNNSVTQDQRGAANGISMSAVSLFKAIGPAAGGSIFAWAQSRQDTYILPGNQLVFFSLGFVAFLSVIYTFEPLLPRSLDEPMPEDEE